MELNFKDKVAKNERDLAAKKYIDGKLGDGEKVTLQELANHYGVTHQAVAKWVKVFAKRQDNIIN